MVINWLFLIHPDLKISLKYVPYLIPFEILVLVIWYSYWRRLLPTTIRYGNSSQPSRRSKLRIYVVFAQFDFPMINPRIFFGCSHDLFQSTTKRNYDRYSLLQICNWYPGTFIVSPPRNVRFLNTVSFSFLQNLLNSIHLLSCFL